ncbi:MAG: hypothetical protein [Caudoviricetes sp.]|nr:MAG: hypothetical protein [Caudoviricetes sp.]
MALVSQSIKNLKGGISQQPDILRFGEQGAEQINGWSSETEGLQKRPPTIFKKNLGAADSFGKKPLVHLINRDAVERYYAIFTGKGIRVIDLDGSEYKVTGDMGYVVTENPRDDLRMVTVADYTFVVNRKKIIKVDPSLTNGGTFRDKGDALINVRGGQYGRTLTIKINGEEVAKKEIPDGGEPKHSKETDAQFLAEDLATKMRTKLTGWTITVGQGYIHIVAPADKTIDSLETKDGYANQLINAVPHYMQSFTKLPVEAPDGYIVKIVGDTSKTADQYYVKFDAAKKVWTETVGWNITHKLDSKTMPWTLIRQADGNFEFKSHEWEPRKAGDNDTNPHPSLVDQPINDIFFFRNRLGFLAGENIVMSRTAKYFNFYPASVANLSDDDPIDVAVSHNRISVLKYAVPFSEELLLWSDQAQFVLSAQGILSSKSVELNLTTEFDVSDGARPFGVGRNVYFASPRATFTSINRYYAVQDVSSVKSAEDITSHVPSYIPNGVFSIHGTSTENYISVLSEGAASKIYLYKFLYLDEEIKQQSWSHWDFGSNVKLFASSSIGSDMFVLAQNEFNVYLATLKFAKTTKDFTEEPYRIYLDMKRSYKIPTGTYDDDLYETHVSLSEVYNNMKFSKGTISVVEPDGRVEVFPEPENGWNNDPVVRLTGNRENVNIIIGFNIKFKYTFSKFLIKQKADDGSVTTEDSGRLQLRRAWVNYENSGAFTVNVMNISRLFSYVMAGARLGSNDLTVGGLNLGTGQYRFPINGNARVNDVSIVSETTTPLNIIGCGWEGNYMRRTSGI